MINKALSLLVVGILTMTVSCKKDEIDVAELTTNPFDADYDGAAIFTFIGSSTAIEVVNGNPIRVLTVQVQVHTELFGRPTTYQVGFDGATGPGTPSNTIPNGVLTFQRSGVESGQQYCWFLRLGNGGTYGGGNQVCATVE